MKKDFISDNPMILKAMGDAMDNKVEQISIVEHTFSPAFERQMNRLIRTQSKPYYNLFNTKVKKTVSLAAAAAVLAVILAVVLPYTRNNLDPGPIADPVPTSQSNTTRQTASESNGTTQASAASSKPSGETAATSAAQQSSTTKPASVSSASSAPPEQLTRPGGPVDEGPMVWGEMTITQQFPRLNWASAEYVRAVNTQVPASQVGDLLGDLTATGYDDILKEEHQAKCKVYSIQGVEVPNAVAVHFAGEDAYYLYLNAEKGGAAWQKMYTAYLLRRWGTS